MKIEIANGRLVAPAAGVDRVTSLYIAAAKVAAIGNGLSAAETRQWDALLAGCRPGAELLGRIKAFRFEQEIHPPDAAKKP